MDEIKTFSPIPVQPMSYRDGVEILKRLTGPVAPEAWRGALPITYHVGPGPAKVHMALHMDYGQRHLIDVVGRITGSEFPDEWVIVGSHRDAWVFGASDSVSGHVSMMSVARAMGEMMKQGWKPRRSDSLRELGRRGAGAARIDRVRRGPGDRAEGARGRLRQPRRRRQRAVLRRERRALADAVRPRADEVDPVRRGATRRSTTAGSSTSASCIRRSDGAPMLKAPEVGALGSGSDYTAFLDHIGVASLDMGLGGTGDDGTYHSIYDDPTWFKKYIDPRLQVQRARVAGDRRRAAAARRRRGAAVRLRVVRQDRSSTTSTEIEKQAAKKSADGREDGRLRRARRRRREAFAKAGADRARGEATRCSAGAPAPQARALAELNHRLIMVERDLIEPAGLPDRPWFRHTIYAPGLYTGYGVKTIPGVREAVDAGNFTRAAEQAQIVIRALAARHARRLRVVARTTGRGARWPSTGRATA